MFKIKGRLLLVGWKTRSVGQCTHEHATKLRPAQNSILCCNVLPYPLSICVPCGQN